METKVQHSEVIPPKRAWREKFRVNKKLIPLKIFMTFFYGGFVALYPYLTIHMKSIGISVSQTGLIYGMYPLCVCIGGPLAGTIGDKTGRYRLTLMIFLILIILVHALLFLAVPSYSVTTLEYPVEISNVQLDLHCGVQKSAFAVHKFSFLNKNATLASCHPGNIVQEPPNNLHIYSCVTDCIDRDVQPNPIICASSADGAQICINLDQLPFQFVKRIVFQNVTGKPKDTFAKWNISETISCFPPTVSSGNCGMTCSAKVNFTMPCFVEQVSGSQLRTFLTYLCIRLLCGLCVNLAFTLVDACLLQMVEDFDGDIGANRAFASVGFCVVPPLAGLLVDYSSKQKGTVDFGPAFYMFFAGVGISIIVLCFTDVRARPGSKNIWKNAALLLRYPRVIATILSYLMIGIAWGFLESFLFWFLDEDLKAEKWLLGFTNTVAGVAGIPFAGFATWIIKRTGYTKIFIFGIFVFGLRFLGYSFVYNPYWVLPLEALEAVTSTLPMIAASVYAASFSAELLATLQGVLAAVHFGLGRGAGSVVGGYMINSMGTRLAFQVFAGICFGVAFAYAVFHYAFLRNLPKKERKTGAPEKGMQTAMISPVTDKQLKEKELAEENCDVEENSDRDMSRRSSLLPVFDLGSTERGLGGMHNESNTDLRRQDAMRRRSTTLHPQ